MSPNNTNTLVASFYAYAQSFAGGVRVAMADVNGDGVLDVITAPGPGAVPLEAGDTVKVWDGAVLTSLAALNMQRFVADPTNLGPNPLNQNALIASFTPELASYKSGLYLAVGDVNNDTKLDIVTSPQQTTAGMQSVRVFENTGTVLNPVYPSVADAQLCTVPHQGKTDHRRGRGNGRCRWRWSGRIITAPAQDRL